MSSEVKKTIQEPTQQTAKIITLEQRTATANSKSPIKQSPFGEKEFINLFSNILVANIFEGIQI
ncbi:MAG: hypothetical protein ACPGXZ_17130 [Saprospiraceae bacterium]